MIPQGAGGVTGLPNKESFFLRSARTALQVCSLSVVSCSSLSYPQHFRWRTCWKRHGDLSFFRDACLCTVSAHGPQGLWKLRKPTSFVSSLLFSSLLLPYPYPGQPGCDDWAYACPYTDRTETDAKAARPKGKRCRDLSGHDENKHLHPACLAQRSTGLPKKLSIVNLIAPSCPIMPGMCSVAG